MTTDQMLAFENKIFGIVISPLNLQKEFLMHLVRAFKLTDQCELRYSAVARHLQPISAHFPFICPIN